MTIYKLLVEKEEPTEQPGLIGGMIICEMTSNDPAIVAETLRAIAGRLDPPRPVIRNMTTTGTTTI